jgi:hypothetical protein
MAYFYTYNAIRLNANQHIAALQGSVTPFATPPPPGGGVDPVYPYESITGNVIYVTTTGSATESRAWALNNSSRSLSLQRAANVVDPGDTVIVRNGTYTRASSGESGFVVDFTRSGTSSNPIRFVSENRWGAVIDGQYTNHSAVRIHNTSHFILEGFEIKRGAFGGIWANGGTGGTNVRIRLNWGHDIANHRTSNPEYVNGVAYYCRKPDGTWVSDQFWGRTTLFTGLWERNWIVEGNIFHNAHRLEGGCDFNRYEQETGGNGKWAPDYQRDHGYYAQGRGHIIRNNIFFGNEGGMNLKLDGASDQGPINEWSFIVVNNTFGGENKRLPGSLGFCASSGTKPRNVLVMNNVLWRPSLGIAVNPCQYSGWGSDYGNTSSERWYGTAIVNNLTNGSAVINPDWIHKWNYSDMVNTGNVATNNMNSTLGMADPRIGERKRIDDSTRTVVTEGNWKLTSGATLIIDKATTTFNVNRDGLPSVTVPNRDYYGVTRPQGSAPDLSAYEFV